MNRGSYDQLNPYTDVNRGSCDQLNSYTDVNRGSYDQLSPTRPPPCLWAEQLKELGGVAEVCNPRVMGKLSTK